MDWTDALEYKTDYDDIIRYLEEKNASMIIGSAILNIPQGKVLHP